jgi:hypothetical protein
MVEPILPSTHSMQQRQPVLGLLLAQSHLPHQTPKEFSMKSLVLLILKIGLIFLAYVTLSLGLLDYLQRRLSEESTLER